MGYDIFRQDRTSSIRKGGGGVLVATKAKLCAENINLVDDTVEHLFIKLPVIKMIISAIYIPPASQVTPYMKHINTAIEIYERHSDYKFVFLGDYII